MDTTEIAEKLGTTPRQLRQFLRSPGSTYVAVGSGSRYEFTESDLPTLMRRFSEWRSGGRSKGRVKPAPRSTPAPSASAKRKRQPSKRDMAVWQEEGEVRVEDIRNPRVRARVKADAAAAEDRLMLLLMSKGLHITQLGDRKPA